LEWFFKNECKYTTISLTDKQRTAKVFR